VLHFDVQKVKISLNHYNTVKSQILSTKSQGFRCRVSGKKDKKTETSTLKPHCLLLGIFSLSGAPLLQLSLASFHKKYNEALHQFRHELEV